MPSTVENWYVQPNAGNDLFQTLIQTKPTILACDSVVIAYTLFNLIMKLHELSPEKDLDTSFWKNMLRFLWRI